MPTIPEIESRYLPQIAAARAAAEERRDLAWVSEFPHTLCGLPVRAITVGDLLALRLAGNAFVTNAPPPDDPAEAAAFFSAHAALVLWRLSPEYSLTPGAREAWCAQPRVRQLSPAALQAEVDAFLRDAFADRPVPVADKASTDHAPLSLAASFVACWVHDFAQAYGWPPSVTLALPLGQLFQLRQLLAFEAALKRGDHPRPAGDEADRLAAACFAEIAALA